MKRTTKKIIVGDVPYCRYRWGGEPEKRRGKPFQDLQPYTKKRVIKNVHLGPRTCDSTTRALNFLCKRKEKIIIRDSRTAKLTAICHLNLLRK